MLLAALAGANMIYGLGMIDLGMTLDFGQLVVDNEIAKMVRKVLGGIPVNEETLAVDVIRKVGTGGHFLMEEHTLTYMRNVQSQSNLFDRNTRQTWEAKGAKDLATRATEEARYILENHKPEPLPAGTAQTLREMIEESEKRWGVKK
jgi:trimethylamine--corrinoid protein Co-methyltransferase